MMGMCHVNESPGATMKCFEVPPSETKVASVASRNCHFRFINTTSLLTKEKVQDTPKRMMRGLYAFETLVRYDAQIEYKSCASLHF